MNNDHQLRREISFTAAVMLGLGSIVGTGVFVSIGIAAGIAGANILPAIFLAALVAICNGLSSAQLAAIHPVSGGTYEYGYHWLSPTAGFTAGWLFLCAKSASAATAALGLAGYLQLLTRSPLLESIPIVNIALVALAGLTVVVVLGIRKTTLINSLIVSVTLGALVLLVGFGLPTAVARAPENLQGLFSFGNGGWHGLLGGAALMFVSYTGYGRIATMGEEVAEPRRTIPRAMIVTLAVTLILYLIVGFVAVAVLGPADLAEGTDIWAAPLLLVAGEVDGQILWFAVSIGAVTAMLGVMLNLLLGLSRVVLAMARRGDMPRRFATINARGVPVAATLLVSVVIAILILIGDVRIAWSFSAVTVLIYYSLTNLCLLRISPEKRIFPVWPAWCGLVSCLGLVFFIDPPVLLSALIVVLAGFVWRTILRKFKPQSG